MHVLDCPSKDATFVLVLQQPLPVQSTHSNTQISMYFYVCTWNSIECYNSLTKVFLSVYDLAYDSETMTSSSRK